MIDTIIEAIARKLRVPIPSPPAPRAKAQKSFATLQPGRRLTNLLEMELEDGRRVPKGIIFEVTEVNSLRARLVALNGPEAFDLSDRKWKDSGNWKTVRRPTKRKAKTK